MSFHVDVIPNRNSPPAILFRQAWREGKRIRRVTLANLSKLPPEIVDGIRAMLRGGLVVSSPSKAFSLRRSLPHGHVAAVLGLCRQLGLERLLHRHPSRFRELAIAAIAARLLEPASKLATARSLSAATAASSLAPLLGLGSVHGNELLAMLDWLLARQKWIEKSLARRHLQGATLLLYDVSSTYLEGRCCPLAACGHSRDGKPSKQQLVFGLLCAADGCPVAVEVFAGNTGDPRSVASQVAKVRKRFGLESVALVGERGMLTTARLREDLEPAGLGWISALKADSIRTLLGAPQPEEPAPLRPGELVADQVAEIRSPDYPGERLLVCLNPRLRAERARKREALLQATEAALETIAKAVRGPGKRLRGRQAINRRVGRDVGRKKVAKHFLVEVEDDRIRWSRRQERIEAEAQLDGVYIIRTSLGAEQLGADETVEAYKSLAQVERAFRSLKTGQLEVRPVYVYNEDHVRGHVLVCLLAYYLEWHLRRRLAPLLFEEQDREAARQRRDSPVEKAQVSESTEAKAASKRTPEGLPVHSLRTLLADLATLTLNEVALPEAPEHAFPLHARPTPLQQKAFDLLGVDPARFVASNLTG